MKSKLSTLLIASVVATYSLSLLPLNQVAAKQQDPRGMRVQQGERRVALVIGNSAYKDSPLLNPVNDAQAMAQALRSFGFEVVYGENLSQNDMKRNIRAFGEKIRNGGVGLFYYAGHGIQVRGSNYLLPVNATITSEDEVEYESVDVGLVLAQMETARNRLNIVILDACRNNPFARSFRSKEKGLSSIDAPGGTLIAYATAPGSVASDGAGRNGLYTQELLKYMKQADLSMVQVFMKVRVAVRSQTEGKQVPWESSSLEVDFYFAASAMAPDVAKNNTPPSFDPASGGAGSPLPLRGFEFETVTVNSSGSVTNRRKGQGKYCTEDLNGVGLEMVEIAGGTFQMGTSDKEAHQVASEYKRSIDGNTIDDNNKALADQVVSWERPQHKVIVPPFYLGKYEVTQAQWRAVARLPKVNRDLVTDPSEFKGDNLPVEKVSWEDAMEFCERLSRATGRQYRLPSEAEWEYACRAGAITHFAFGDTITPELVNYCGTYPYGAAPRGYISPTDHSGRRPRNSECIWIIRYAWQCVGMVPGHLARELQWARRVMEMFGKAAIRDTGLCGVVHGTSAVTMPAQPTASGSRRTTDTTTTGFVWFLLRERGNVHYARENND